MKSFSVLLIFILTAFPTVAQMDISAVTAPVETNLPAIQPDTNTVAVQINTNPVAAQTDTNMATVLVETNAVPIPPPITDITAVPVGMNAATRQMSLEDCIQEALQHNLDVQIERYNPQISLYNLRAAYGGYDPLFNISGQHNYNVQLPYRSS